MIVESYGTRAAQLRQEIFNWCIWTLNRLHYLWFLEYGVNLIDSWFWAEQHEYFIVPIKTNQQNASAKYIRVQGKDARSDSHVSSCCWTNAQYSNRAPATILANNPLTSLSCIRHLDSGGLRPTMSCPSGCSMAIMLIVFARARLHLDLVGCMRSLGNNISLIFGMVSAPTSQHLFRPSFLNVMIRMFSSVPTITS